MTKTYVHLIRKREQPYLKSIEIVQLEYHMNIQRISLFSGDSSPDTFTSIF